MESQIIKHSGKNIWDVRWEELSLPAQNHAVDCGIEAMAALIHGTEGAEVGGVVRPVLELDPEKQNPEYNERRGHHRTRAASRLLSEGLARGVAYKEYLAALIASDGSADSVIAAGEAQCRAAHKRTIERFNRSMASYLNRRGRAAVLAVLTRDMDEKLTEVIADVNAALEMHYCRKKRTPHIKKR